MSAVHKAAGEGELDLARTLDTCVHAEKIRELVVNEKSSLRQKDINTKRQKYKKIKNTFVHAEKIRELVVNEKSSLRELTIAVLMTHWDFIAPVFFYR